MSLLAWQRATQPGDDYALVPINPDAVDVSRLKNLFAAVKTATGASSKRTLHADASAALQRWLDAVSCPLPSPVYARLSNWFLTDKKGDRESVLAERCAALWDALFVTRPPKRLTPTDDNASIIDITFQVWWKKQQELQGKRE